MKQKDIDRLPYRPCVGIALFNRDGLVWTGNRSDKDAEGEGEGHWWQMPQGGLDEGEDPHKAALRELYEETSVKNASLIKEAPGWLTYDLPKELVGQSWGGRYRGQKQKWFALRFEAKRVRSMSSTPAVASTRRNSHPGAGKSSSVCPT
jgi:putative (di)nucleoside polyphosphate hydrolase